MSAAARADHDGDPVRIGAADPLRAATPAGTRNGATTARSPFASIVRRHRSHTALGVVTLFAAAADLALARRLDVADHRRPDPGDPALVGERPIVDRRSGCAASACLTTPEETSPPADRRARQCARRRTRPHRPGRATTDCAPGDLGDPAFASRTRIVPCPRRRGIGAARSMSTTRSRRPSSTTRRSVEEARAWLKPKERLAVLERSRADRHAGALAERGRPAYGSLRRLLTRSAPLNDFVRGRPRMKAFESRKMAAVS